MCSYIHGCTACSLTIKWLFSQQRLYQIHLTLLLWDDCAEKQIDIYVCMYMFRDKHNLRQICWTVSHNLLLLAAELNLATPVFSGTGNPLVFYPKISAATKNVLGIVGILQCFSQKRWALRSRDPRFLPIQRLQKPPCPVNILFEENKEKKKHKEKKNLKNM